MSGPSYSIQYSLSVLTAVALVMIGSAITASQALGLSAQQVAILGIVSAGLGVFAGTLPRLQKPPSDDRRGQD